MNTNGIKTITVHETVIVYCFQVLFDANIFIVNHKKKKNMDKYVLYVYSHVTICY